MAPREFHVSPDLALDIYNTRVRVRVVRGEDGRASVELPPGFEDSVAATYDPRTNRLEIMQTKSGPGERSVSGSNRDGTRTFQIRALRARNVQFGNRNIRLGGAQGVQIGDNNVWTDGSDNRRGWNQEPIEVVVRVPGETTTVVDNRSGDVDIRGVGGALEVRTSSGDITARDVHGVRGSSSSGDLDVKRVTGEVAWRTASGDVEIKKADLDTVRVQTSSGDVRMTGHAASVEVQTSSGDVDIDGSLGRASVRSSSGDVEMTGKFDLHAVRARTNGRREVRSSGPYEPPSRLRDRYATKDQPTRDEPRDAGQGSQASRASSGKQPASLVETIFERAREKGYDLDAMRNDPAALRAALGETLNEMLATNMPPDGRRIVTVLAELARATAALGVAVKGADPAVTTRYAEQVKKLASELDEKLVSRGVAEVVLNPDGVDSRILRAVSPDDGPSSVNMPVDRRLLKSIGLTASMIVEVGGPSLDISSGRLTPQERAMLGDPRLSRSASVFAEGIHAGAREAGGFDGPDQAGGRTAPSPTTPVQPTSGAAHPTPTEDTRFPHSATDAPQGPSRGFSTPPRREHRLDLAPSTPAGGRTLSTAPTLIPGNGDDFRTYPETSLDGAGAVSELETHDTTHGQSTHGSAEEPRLGL